MSWRSVACHISFRDIKFTPAPSAVKIVVTTDIASHLFLRLSSGPPQIHRKSSLRRGYRFFEDLRFCFTVFEDNEQSEAGDTLTHTWVKPDWPVCTTKYFYLWGSVAGETCPSTSAVFDFHQTAVTPPVPVKLFECYPVQNVSLAVTKYQHTGATFPLTGWALVPKVWAYLAKASVGGARDVTAGIYVTDYQGKPVGDPLAEKTLDCSWIWRVPEWSLVTFEFDTPVILLPYSQYILWLSSTSGYPEHQVLWRARNQNVCPNTFIVYLKTETGEYTYLPTYDLTFGVWGNYL